MVDKTECSCCRCNGISTGGHKLWPRRMVPSGSQHEKTKMESINGNQLTGGETESKCNACKVCNGDGGTRTTHARASRLTVAFPLGSLSPDDRFAFSIAFLRIDSIEAPSRRCGHAEATARRWQLCGRLWVCSARKTHSSCN